MAMGRTILLTGFFITTAIAGFAGQASAQPEPLGCCLAALALSSPTTCADMIPEGDCSTANGSFVAGGKCQGGTPIPSSPAFIGGICAPAASLAPAMSKNVMLMVAAMLAAVGMLRLARRRRADG